jgi:hypothetical protein
VVITRGFRDDPHLDLLDEAQWRLEVDLSEEQWLEATRLVAIGFGGWVTILQPPWYGSDERPTRWEVLQWREDENGEEVDRAKKAISVSEALDVVPARFHAWAIDTTAEALEALEEVDPELGSVEAEPSLDDGAAMLAEISTLRAELAAARDRREELRRRRECFYGHLYIYEFSPDTDLFWRIDTVAGEAEWLIVRDADEKDDRFARVLIPPDELTEWRWTQLRDPEAGGEYMTPSEALVKVPREFRGWVAAKTYEALQRARHSLYELSGRTLVDTDDLARMVRLARHAQRLASLAQGSDVAYLGAPEIDEEDLVTGTRSPDGRMILLFTASWGHVLAGHPEMEDHLDMVMKTLEDPEHREPDQRVGRERFFRRGGPEAWMRVVVELDGHIDRVITAFPQANPPQNWRHG